MKPNLLYLLIIVAVLISAALSYQLIQNIQTANQAKKQAAQQRLSRSNGQNASSVSPKKSTNPFGIPPQSASEDTINKFWADIKLRATKTDTVDIANCKPKPQIAYLTMDKPFTLINSGIKPLRIDVTEELSYTVPSKGKLELVADFKKGIGIYDYRCDNSPQSVGVMLIVNP